jgi:aspartate racemase
VREARSHGNWRPLGDLVVRAARGVRNGGAEAIVLCSNSLHGVAHRVEAEVGLPLLHIADGTADRALAGGHEVIALFGTGFTMTQPFLRDRLRERGLQVLVPEAIEVIDRLILEELARGIVRDESRAQFQEALAPLVDAGATAVVLGCTELPMLIGPDDVPIPVLDTLELHVEQATAWQLTGCATLPP